MYKPPEAELRQALQEADRMRATSDDRHFVGRALLSHDYRLQKLENVLARAKHYLHSGLAPHEHSELIKAIEQAETASKEPGEEQPRFGLDPGE